MVVFGTRPEGIKMAPLIKELINEKDTKLITVSTGQHKEMLDQVLDMYQIKIDENLNIMKPNQTLAEITSAILNGMDAIIRAHLPDIVLIHGDTTTSFSAGLAAYYNKIPVAHVEAGLRTGDVYSPFPEELNRRLNSKLATLHFAPTKHNKQNLNSEGIFENVWVTGNTSIDALHFIDSLNSQTAEIENLIQDINGKYALVTLHRRENLSQLPNILQALNDIAFNYKKHFIFPVHLNPVVQRLVKKYLYGNKFIHLIAPQPSSNFIYLMKNSQFVITDSGGIQEEAPSFQKPVFVVRENTERVEGIENETIELIGNTREQIYQTLSYYLDDETKLSKFLRSKNPYGNGDTSSIINKIIRKFLNENTN